jgi:predicted DNA-binding WGR domain protein
MSDLTKVTNNLSRFDGLEPSYDERLDFFDKTQNKNKFWHIRVFGEFIVRNYGRHGTNGQTVVHQAYSTWDAKEEADKLYWKKKDKGYVKDTTTILDRLVREVE